MAESEGHYIARATAFKLHMFLYCMTWRKNSANTGFLIFCLLKFKEYVLQASCLQNITLPSQIFVCYNYFPSKLLQLHAQSKDPIADFLGLTAPSPQCWGDRVGVLPQTVPALQIWGKYIRIKKHLLKLLWLLYKVQEVFKSKEVFLEMLSFRGIFRP